MLMIKSENEMSVDSGGQGLTLDLGMQTRRQQRQL